MAIFFPPEPPKDIPKSEGRVWKALERVEDDWRVFHHVAWQSERWGKEGDGEADFVLLRPSVGLLVLEVKGGEISVDHGRWESQGEKGRFEIRNPFDQAVDSKKALGRHLEEVIPNVRCPVNHAVAFPNGDVPGDIAMYGPREIVLDRTDLARMNVAIDRVTSHWATKANLTRSHCDSITRSLAPTMKIETRLRSRLAEADRRLLDLTDQQIGTLQLLRRVRRAAIVGGAGTGKTILAIERARRLRDEGFPTALLCFNAPLGGKLAAEPALEGVTTGTFHSFTSRLIRAAGGAVPDFESSWWEQDVADELLAAAEATGTRLGAIVLDEAQDFRAEWMEALALILDDPQTSPFYVFVDSNQTLYVDEWGLPEDWPEFPLDVNCRSTLPIAARVNAVFGDDVSTLGTTGPAPIFVEADPAEQAEVVTQLVYRLLADELLEPAQIVVLAETRRLVESLRRRVVGDSVFVDGEGHGVLVETIHRFKGLEAETAIVVFTSEPTSDIARRLAYVGLSRARVMLVVVGSKATRRALNW